MTEPAAPATPPETPPETPEEPRTFSEDQVNRIVQERLARDRKERPSDEEIATLRESATKLAEIETANASDLEKAQKRAEDAEKAQKASDDRAKAALVRASVTAEAAKQGAVDPDAVLALLPADSVTVDGEAVTGAEDAVKALLESKDYLVKKDEPTPAGGGGARTPVEPKDLDAQIAEAEKNGDVNLAISLKSRKILALT